MTAWQQAWPRPLEHALRPYIRIDDHADKAVAHLVPILRTPHDLFRRIGIKAVIGGVIEVLDPDHARALGHIDRLG
jgi:hypothetical protein